MVKCLFDLLLSVINCLFFIVVIIALISDFPSDYPECHPIINIESIKGLSDKQISELLAISNRVSEENLGTSCIFMIAEALKDWLLDNNIAGQDGSMYAEMMKRMQLKDVKLKKEEEKAAHLAYADAEQFLTRDKQTDPEEEERLRKRQAGTQVTVETFMIWKKKFDDEMAKSAQLEGKEIVKDEKLSGKQLFLSNKANLEDGILAAIEAEENNLNEEDIEFDMNDYNEDEDSDYDPDDNDDEDYNDEEDES